MNKIWETRYFMNLIATQLLFLFTIKLFQVVPTKTLLLATPCRYFQLAGQGRLKQLELLILLNQASRK